MTKYRTSRVGADVLEIRLLEIGRIAALVEMAGGMSHELNQPLGAIATFAQAGDRLLNRAEPMVGRALDVFRQISTEALAAGERLRRMRGFLSESSPQRSQDDVPQAIEEMKPLLNLMARRTGVALSFDIATSCPPVCIDRTWIQHVVFALVENACHACGDGEHAARIQVAVSTDQDVVEVSVADCGSGVADSATAQLFRPFFTTKTHAAGLGLASCRTIVETHEGTIGFDPVPTGGSRFWFRLPGIRS